MKKLILLMTAFALCTGVGFADNGGKGKKKKCAKGKSCCTKKTDAAATTEAAAGSTTATLTGTATAGEKPAGKTCDKAMKSCCKSKAKAE